VCQRESRRKTDEVRLQARGHWDEIFARLVPQITPALARPGRHVDCPFHGGKDDFRVASNFQEEGRCFCTCGTWDGFGMVMHANGWDFVRAVKAVKEVLDGGSVQSQEQARQEKKVDQQRQDAFVRQTLRRWWSESLPLDDPFRVDVALRYFAIRGLARADLSLPDIRFHPDLEYRGQRRRVIGSYPALLAAVRSPSGDAVTIHRTWLDKDGNGKAPVDAPRKQFLAVNGQTVTGAAIRLYSGTGPVLHVAEGLETALSVRALTGPLGHVWSTLNKGLMERLEVPEGIQKVCIWADRDIRCGGEASARILMERLQQQGKQAMVVLPPGPIPDGLKSIDWNDVVKSLGVNAAKRHFSVVKCLRELKEDDPDASQGATAVQRLSMLYG